MSSQAACVVQTEQASLSSRVGGITRADGSRSRRTMGVICGLLAFLLAASDSLQASVAPSPYGGLPVVFEPNRGQAEAEVYFLSRAAGHVLFLTASEAVLVLDPAKLGSKTEGDLPPVVLRLGMRAGNPQSRPEAEDLLPSRSHYYQGTKPSDWIEGVPHYGQIRYGEVYPGIDLVFHGRQRMVEYEFVVAPGADPGQIGFKIEGANGISVASDGDLILSTAAGEVRFRRPLLYQEGGGERQIVVGAYSLEEPGIVAFAVGDYDISRPLVIDPVLQYAGFLGANNPVEPTAVAVDADGQAFLVGHTWSNTFPTRNALYPNPSSQPEWFLTKFTPLGNDLVFSTYLGPFRNVGGIAMDADGSVYIAGFSDVAIPVTSGAHQVDCAAGEPCGYMAKFRPDGTLALAARLGTLWPTDVAVDGENNIYVTGSVSSFDMPVVNPFQGEFSPGTFPALSRNAFVQKLDPMGAVLLYSTYFGSRNVEGRTIGVGGDGSIYVVGTGSGTVPLRNAIQIQPSELFVTRFTPDGSNLVYSTYFGVGGELFDATVGPTGSVHAVGMTRSPDFPLTLDAFETDCGPRPFLHSCDHTGFAFKLSSEGALLYSTLLGPGWATAVAAGPDDTTFVTGRAGRDFRLVNPIQGWEHLPSSGGGRRAFLTRLGWNGNPIYSTVFGGAGMQTEATGIAVDGSSNVYLTGRVSGGHSDRMDLPVLNPFQNSAICCGISSGFVAKIANDDVPGLSLAPLRGPVVYLRNVSTLPLQLHSITPGTAIKGSCPLGGTLPPGGFCIFLPQASTVTVYSNAPGSPHTFSLNAAASGPAAGPQIRFVPGSLGFSRQRVNSTSVPKRLTVINVGTVAAALHVLRVSDQFTQVSSCPAVLEVGESCAIDVRFRPAAQGPQGGALVLIHDPNASRSDIPVGGSGTFYSIETSLLGLWAGKDIAGRSGLPRVVNLANSTTQPITLTVAISGPFVQSNDCPPTLPAAGTCRVAVRFHPLINGNASGLLTVQHNGPGPGLEIPLSGIGFIDSELEILPLQVQFGSVLLGTAAIQQVNLRNGGTGPLTLGGITFSRTDFSQTNDCPTALAVEASCAIMITFQPAEAEDRGATMSVEHSGQGNPQVIPLLASGRYALRMVPPVVDFQSQTVSQASGLRSVSVANDTTSPVTIDTVTVTGDYQVEEEHCTGVLLGHSACGVHLRFLPTQEGMRPGQLAVNSSDRADPYIAVLMGLGVSEQEGPGTAALMLSGVDLDFGAQLVGVASDPLVLTLSSTGTASLHITSMAATAPFQLVNLCPLIMAPQANCDVQVWYVPLEAGSHVGQLVISSDADGSPHSVTLRGSSTGAGARLSHVALAFAPLGVGSQSAQQTVTLSSSGDQTLGITSIHIAGEDFRQTNDCPSALAVGATCDIQMSYAPTISGVHSSLLSVNTNAGGSPHLATLAGQGLDFSILAAPGSSVGATINAGQSAVFQGRILPSQDFAGNVQLGCRNLPLATTCSFAPSTVNVPANGHADFQLTVRTTARSGASLHPGLLAPFGVVGILLMGGALGRQVKRRRRGMLLALLAGFLFVLPACGGGGNIGGGGIPAPLGTPAGSYEIKATATGPSGTYREWDLLLVVR